MTTSSQAPTTPALTRRDRALLTAVATGRCQLTPGPLPHLLVDGRCACDQLAAYQLLAHGLIAANPSRRPRQPSVGEPPTATSRATLTAAGRAALGRDGDSIPVEC